MRDSVHLGNIVSYNARAFKDKIALILEDGRMITYQELNEGINRLAHFFLERGIKKGEKVGFILNNSLEFMEVYFASCKIGAVSVPMNWRLKPQEIKEMLIHADVSILVFGSEFLGMVEEIRQDLPSIKLYLFVGKEAPSYAAPYSSKDSCSSREVEVNEYLRADDPAQFLYTGGTTGLPKCAVYTHHTAIWNAINCLLDKEIRYGQRALHVLPWFHSSWTDWVIIHLLKGCTNVVRSRAVPERILEDIQKYEINNLFLMPPLFLDWILKVGDKEKYDTRFVSLISTHGGYCFGKGGENDKGRYYKLLRGKSGGL